VGEQHWNRHLTKKVTANSAYVKFSASGRYMDTENQEVDIIISYKVEQSVAYTQVSRGYQFYIGRDFMQLKVTGKSFTLTRAEGRLIDRNYLDTLGSPQQRHGVIHRTGSLGAGLPGNHDSLANSRANTRSGIYQNRST
jgi:hypothetical protein